MSFFYSLSCFAMEARRICSTLVNWVAAGRGSSSRTTRYFLRRYEESHGTHALFVAVYSEPRSIFTGRIYVLYILYNSRFCRPQSIPTYASYMKNV